MPLFRAALAVCLTWTFAAAHAALLPSPLYLDVPVSDIGNDNSLAESNTSRKLAVGADGAIYALFRSAANGIRVVRSIDRGQSFGPSVQVAAANAEAEIAIASDGDLHVIWISGGNILHSVSRDGAATFSAPSTVGAGNASAHMALDGDRVYVVPRPGNVVYRSDDDGETFAQTPTGGTYAFADIFVDPTTRDVLLIVDDPAVSFYVSKDFGQTFAGPTATGKSVFYSVGALASTEANRYLFLAGSSTNLERIEPDAPAYHTAAVAATAGNTTRSLSADVFGNVVSGYLEAGTNDLKFEHSNDIGATFGAATTVVNAATRANAAINTINGDILFLYEKSNQIYLSTYERGLVGYDVNVSPSSLNFGAVEVGSQASLPITLTNVSANGVALLSLSASAGYAVDDDCGGSIPASGACTVTVTFAPNATGSIAGVLSLQLGPTIRQVSLGGSGLPVRQSTATQLTASDSRVGVGESVTLTALVTGTGASGTVAFTEGAIPIAGCAAVALSGTSASCTVGGLSAGTKQYRAAYSGDATNAPSTSAAYTVEVGSFVVTAGVSAGGAIEPGAPRTVTIGDQVTFTVTPDAGYRIDAVSGCAGTLSGAAYTTGPITADCTVSATFAVLATDPGEEPPVQEPPVDEPPVEEPPVDEPPVKDTPDERVEVVAKSRGGGGAMGWPMLLFVASCVLARRSGAAARRRDDRRPSGDPSTELA